MLHESLASVAVRGITVGRADTAPPPPPQLQSNDVRQIRDSKTKRQIARGQRKKASFINLAYHEFSDAGMLKSSS